MTNRHQALTLIKQALVIWETDPDEASVDEQQLLEDLHEVAIKLARMTGEPEPG